MGAWRVVGGTAEVEGVPPGPWTLRASTADGRTWEEAIVTASEPEVAVNLR